MARLFDGVTDRIDFANSRDWGATAQSMSCWMYYVADAGNLAYVATDHQSGDGNWGTLYGITVTDEPRFSMQTSGTNVTRTSSQTLTDATLYHMVWTWDGSNTASNVHIYLNGTEVSGYGTTQNGTGTPVTSTGSTSYGGRIWDDSRMANIELSEVGRWTRVLSASEITLLSKGYSPKFITNGLESYIPFTREAQDHVVGVSGTLDGTSIVTPRKGIIYPVGSSPLVTTSNTGAPIITVPTGTFRLLDGVETSVPTGVAISGGDPGDIVMTIACTSGVVGVADAGTVEVANENTTSMTLTGTAAELTTLFAATSGGLTGITYKQTGQTADTITFDAVDSGTNNSTQRTVSVAMYHGKVTASNQADLNLFFVSPNLKYTHNTVETVDLTMLSIDEAGNTDQDTVTITVEAGDVAGYMARKLLKRRRRHTNFFNQKRR